MIHTYSEEEYDRLRRDREIEDAANRLRRQRRWNRGQALDFLEAYIREALRTETHNGEPLGKRFTREDIRPEVYSVMHDHCIEFIKANHTALFDFPPKAAGRDFWLTRNGHGAGYWDGDYPEPAATVLTQAAKKAGEVALYIGDDGQLHHFPG